MIKGGPKIINDGIVFCIDTADIKCVSKAGCMGFTNAAQLLKNLISISDTITTTSNLRLGNLSFFTIYGITYPEGNYSPTSRDGITPGFNDTSSSMTYNWSRDMNYAVWDNATNSWVPDSYFNGERVSGHCYDTYDTNGNAATEHVQFQDDYRDIVTAYPDATHIVVGSHAAENNDSDANTLAILQDLGGPSSWPTDRAEYVLIGKPGLGAGNAYVWQYQNNSSEVAHANVGLPILGGKTAGQNYLEFDGSNDYIDGPTIAPNIGAFTYEAVIYRTSSDFLAVGTGTALGGGTYMQIFVYDAGMRVNLYAPQGIGGGWRTGSTIPNTSNTFVNNNIYHVTVVNDGTVFYFYKNGVSLGSYDHSYLSNTSSTRLGILRNHVQSVGGSGRVYLARMYNKALTSAEVLQNYNATKGRFS